MINYVYYTLSLLIAFLVFCARNKKYFYVAFFVISLSIISIIILSKICVSFKPLPLWYRNLLTKGLIYYAVYFMNFVFVCMIRIIWDRVLTRIPLDFENSKIKYIYIFVYGAGYIFCNITMNYGVWLS